MTEQLDIRGMVCPFSTTEVIKAMKQLPEGVTLEVHGDFPPARHTLPARMTDLGYPHEVQENDDGTYTISIEKTVITEAS